MGGKTLEEQATEAILQQSKIVDIGGKTYKVSPPTLATLIMASSAVSRLPNRKLDADNIITECLNIAKDCEPIADVLAILTLGAKLYNEPCRTPNFFTKIFRKRNVTKGEELRNEILNTLSPSELNSTLAQLLQEMELSDFFAVTTFLTEVNILKPTKVETEVTARGQ